MKLGALIAILGEHGHVRDTLCTTSVTDLAHGIDRDEEEPDGVGEATASGPASWPE